MTAAMVSNGTRTLDAGHRAAASYHEHTGDGFSSEITGGIEHRAALARDLSARIEEAQRWQEAREHVERSGLDFNMQAPGLMRHWLIGKNKDDVGISTPNSLSPVWTQREVDTLVGAFNRSEPWAVDVVGVIANKMAKDPDLVSGLAGIETTPTPNAVHGADGSFRANVKQAGSGVAAQGQAWRGESTGAAASAGVPSASAVTGRFGSTVADAVTNQNAHIGAVNTGEREVEEGKHRATIRRRDQR